MSIFVKCEVPVYDKNCTLENDKVLVERVPFESNMVKITFKDITFKVCGSDMSEAVNKCVCSSSAWNSI